MSTPGLERAIAAARWQGAEADVFAATSKLLDIDPAVVARVVFVWAKMKTEVENAVDGLGTREWLNRQFVNAQRGMDLPLDITDTIDRVVAYTIRRIVIRHHMEHDHPICVPFSKLVPASTPSRICDGCPWQFECVRDLLSTPQSCLAGKIVLPRSHGPDDQRKVQYVLATVKPVKLATTRVSVVADHPRGSFEVDLLDVVL